MLLTKLPTTCTSPAPQNYVGNDDDPSCTSNGKASRLSTTFQVRAAPGWAACVCSPALPAATYSGRQCMPFHPPATVAC